MAEPLDAAALAAIRERLERIPAAPWQQWCGSGWPREWASFGYGDGTGIAWPIAAEDAPTDGGRPTDWIAVGNTHEVQDFIANARTDLPRLLDAYTHQQEEIERLQDKLGDTLAELVRLRLKLGEEPHAAVPLTPWSKGQA